MVIKERFDQYADILFQNQKGQESHLKSDEQPQLQSMQPIPATLWDHLRFLKGSGLPCHGILGSC
jgi:hypothetical protein